MIKEFNIISVLGFNVFSDNLIKIPIQGEKCRVVNCSIGPNEYGLATKDEEFKKALQKTDFLVLDGVYFALASIFLLGRNIKRNQGPDVFKHFITRLNEISGKAFFLGSTEKVLKKIKERINRDYPNIFVSYFSPPFKKEFSDEDNLEMLERINDFAPNILFVGLSAPKQEKWSIKHRERLNSDLVISIGAVFDWYGGTYKEISPIFFKLRMVWLVRIFQRPEIFKRDMGNKMLFLWHLFLIILRLKKIS